MALNTDHLLRCLDTLEHSVAMLRKQQINSIEYEVFRNAVIKGYELSLETSGKLLKKALKPYFASPLEVEQLVFKDVFRQASKHGLLSLQESKRWFDYLDNRNNTAHDYGIGFAEETLRLISQFITDAKRLKTVLDHAQP